ncbi:MAG: DUF4129 domain-containing protein [Ginsengibacter sp.]
MKRWLLFLLLIVNTACLHSQTRVKRDTSSIALRSFNNTALKQLKSQKDFQYNKAHEPALSLWDKFWNWFWWKVSQVLKTKGGRITFWSTLIILGVAVIIFFVIKITGMDQNSLFGRSGKGLKKYSVSQDDIHHISFEDEIEKAINVGNFRLAIRLQYLHALKILSDKGYIDWRINKTNTDYIAEIKHKSFNDVFTRLTFNFEYTWYGEKQVSSEEFTEVRHQFQQFNKQVQ